MLIDFIIFDSENWKKPPSQFFLFSRLVKNETKLRTETKLSETKLSGASILLQIFQLQGLQKSLKLTVRHG